MRITPKSNKKKKDSPLFPPKYQFGGLTLPTGFMDQINSTNFGDYSSIQNSAEAIGGQNVADAFAQDNPDIITGNFLQQFGKLQALEDAYAANPIQSAEEISNQAEELAKKQTFLGIGKKKRKRKNEELLTESNQNKIKQNETIGAGTTQSQVTGLLDQFGNTNNLISFLDNLQFQQGGTISQLGYSDNSPYRNLPQITIPGSNITMENTGVPLMVLPDVGTPRIMQPYSGTHMFPGASQVKEIPMKQQGGTPRKDAPTYTGVPTTGESILNNELMAKASKGMGTDTAAAIQLADKLFSDYVTAGHVPEIVLTTEQATKDPDNPIDWKYQGIPTINGITPKEWYKVHIDTIWDPKEKKWSKQYDFIPKLDKLKKPIPRAKTGGKINYFQQGGQGAIGAQLEDGEYFVTPNLDIMETAATMSHKEMKKKDKKDQPTVTDILSGGDYVLSAMDNMVMTRKEAEDMSFGIGGMVYEEGEKPALPVKSGPVDLFKEGEKEVSLVDYVKRIQDKFKINSDERGSVFTRKTNDANRESRLGYIQAVTAINNKKKKGPKAQQGFASTFENKFNTDITNSANIDNEDGQFGVSAQKGQVPEFQGGGPLDLILGALPAIGGIFGGIGQLGSARNNRNDIQKFLTQDREDINTLADTQSQFSGLSTAASLAGIAGQDPNVEATQYDPTQLDSMIRRTPKSLFDFQSSRLAAASKPYLDQLFQNAGSFGQAVNAYAPTAAANASSMASLGVDQVNRDIGLENQYRQQRQAFNDRQAATDTTARNATRTNTNQLTAGAAGILSGGIAGQGNIQTDRLNSLRSNNAAQTQNVVNWRDQKNQAWRNIIGAGAQGANNLIDIRSDNMGQNAERNRRALDSTPVAPIPMANTNAPQYLQMPNGTFPGQESVNPYLPPRGIGVPPPSQFRYNPIPTGVPFSQTPLPWNQQPTGWVVDQNGNFIPG